MVVVGWDDVRMQVTNQPERGIFRDTIRRNLEAMARELLRNPSADQSTWEAMVLELVELDASTEKPS